MSKKYTLSVRKNAPRTLFAFISLLCLLSFFANDLKAQTLPRPDHIIIIIEENQPNALVLGSSAAPFINQIAADSDAVTFTKFYAIEHPSQGNYLDMFAGGNQGVLDDNLPANYPFTTPNMARELLDKGLSFITYSQDLPNTGSDVVASSVGSYVRKHNPVTNWVGTGLNQVPDTVNQPFTNFPTDFSKLPTVCYVVPNEDSDMHNGSVFSTPSTITIGDYWMKQHLSDLMTWIKNNNALFIYTFDEDDGFANNNIPTVFYGPMVKGGTCTTHYTLFSLLRTIEDMYGTGHAGAAASATPITDVWKTTSTGINSIEASSSLQVYPNPASSVIRFDGSKLADASGDIIITDLTGRTIAQYSMPTSKKLELSTTDYPSGLYFYHFAQNGKTSLTGKFAVSHQ